MVHVRCEITRFDSEQELCEEVASRWLRWLDGSSTQPAEPLCVGLSGGRVADRFFPELAARLLSRGRPLDGVHFFWADERCVPADDAESNYSKANRLLFRPLQLPPGQVHRIRGEMPPEAAAAEAEAEISRIASLGQDGYPVLDLVLLGMGEDGHTASLFPPVEPVQLPGRGTYIAVKSPKPPIHRITLSYRCLAIAREAWVLVAGPGKVAAMTASLDPGGSTPLGRLLQLRSQTRLFIHTPDPCAVAADD